MKFHVRTLAGLEPVLAEELRELGAQAIDIRHRVVVCEGDTSFLYKANLWCRTAIRILVPVKSAPCPDEKSLYEAVRKVSWSQWMRPEQTLMVDAHVYSAFTTHSLYVSQLAKDAIVDQFRERTGMRPSVDRENPALRVSLSLFENQLELFVDSSNHSLHRRGYRLQSGEAPLNETLAAGILKLTGWDPTQPLLDPMCGSGTFLIEAALMGRNIAPGLLRKHYGFQNWKDYDPCLFETLVKEARARVRNGLVLDIRGLEKDPAVVQIALENAKRAGVNIRVEAGDFFEWTPPAAKGALVMNPPYNERMAVEDVATLYEQLGDRLKRQYAGWKAFIFSGNADAIRFLGLRTSRRIPLYNGSIECRLLEYELRAPTSAEPRKPRPENPLWIARAQMFGNRLRKKVRKAQGNYRLYDWDIPELPFIVDVEGDRLRFSEVPRRVNHSPLDHARYVKLMVKTACQITGISETNASVEKTSVF